MKYLDCQAKGKKIFGDRINIVSRGGGKGGTIWSAEKKGNEGNTWRRDMCGQQRRKRRTMFEETKYYLQWDKLGRYVSKDQMTDLLYVNCFFFNSPLLFPKKVFEKAVMGSVFVFFFIF